MAEDRAYDSRRVPNLERQERMEGKFGADIIEMRERPDPHQAELDAMDAEDRKTSNG